MGPRMFICFKLIGFALLALFECGQCNSNSSGIISIDDRNTTSHILSDIEAKNCTGMDSSYQKSCVLKSRRKRYVAFPEGSSFSVSLCDKR